MDAGTMKGNYSAQAILKSALPQDREAFKRRFGRISTSDATRQGIKSASA
jgi:hypothetical protein